MPARESACSRRREDLRTAQTIVERFGALAFVDPTRADHIEAAGLQNTCRRRGVQIGTFNALLARLCIRHELVTVSTDRDFAGVAKQTPLNLWR